MTWRTRNLTDDRQVLEVVRRGSPSTNLVCLTLVDIVSVSLYRTFSGDPKIPCRLSETPSPLLESGSTLRTESPT